MLFDLTRPGRKTAVRIIFGFLAFIFAAGFIVVLLLAAIFAGPINSAVGTPDPNTTNAKALDIDQFGIPSAAGPSGAHPLGTDSLVVLGM